MKLGRRPFFVSPYNGQDNRVAGEDSPFNCRAVGDIGSSVCYPAILRIGLSAKKEWKIQDNEGCNENGQYNFLAGRCCHFLPVFVS